MTPRVRRIKMPGPTPTPIVLSASRTELCLVSFQLPAGWTAESRDKQARSPMCSLGLLPPEYAQFVAQSEVGREAYPITLEVSPTVAEAALAGGFTYRDGQWLVHGRMDSESATSRVEGTGWRGFLGEPTIGMHDKNGYAGLGDTKRVLVLGPAGRSAVLDVSVIEYMGVFSRILESLRFSAPPEK